MVESQFTAETQRTQRRRREKIKPLRNICVLCVSAVNRLPEQAIDNDKVGVIRLAPLIIGGET